AADYRPAVGERAERETDARREIVLVRLERFARSGGDGIGAYQALLGLRRKPVAGNDQLARREIEVGLRPVALLPRSLNHVAQPEIQGQSLRHLPVILRVGAVARLIEEADRARRGAIGEDRIAEQEVGESVRRLRRARRVVREAPVEIESAQSRV